MVQNQEQPVGRITFSILIALSLSHCLNDLLQSVISAAYPLFKDDLGLNFAQIGLITLVYQLSASVFQPITGIIFDKHPVAWSLPIGMSFTMIGMINLAFSNNLYWMLVSVFLIGIGSSVLHPEASRITFLASGGKRGLAQSLFQVGGNLGGSLGPLLVALLVAPYGREHLAVFTLFALAAIGVMYPICKWYKSYLNRMKEQKATVKKAVHLPLPMDKTALSIGILLILIFSKYIYMASLTSYYTFYLIHHANVSNCTRFHIYCKYIILRKFLFNKCVYLFIVIHKLIACDYIPIKNTLTLFNTFYPFCICLKIRRESLNLSILISSSNP